MHVTQFWDRFGRANSEVAAPNIVRVSSAESSDFIRDTGVGDIAKQVVEGVIGERNHEYTTDFVLDHNMEKTLRGMAPETPKMS